jgi:FemAB-related protein (PEP-CTERM system-associated)
MNIRTVDSFQLPTLEDRLEYIGLDSWTAFVECTYGYHAHRLVAFEDEKPVGALVLTEVWHPIFGHYLTTAPYGNYGGFAFENVSARDALLEAAARLTVRVGATYVNVRVLEDDSSTPPAGWTPHPIYATYQVILPSAAEELLSSFSSDHRNHIRKSLKKGFTIRFGHLELLEDTYRGLSVSMHELGSPYHRKSYLRNMAESLGESFEFAVVYDSQGKIAGSGVFITQGEVISNLHANVLKETRSSYTGEFLYWSVIERAIAKKLKTFDLGRSLIGSGNETFKLKWAQRKLPLAYWYWLTPNQELPSINQKNPKFQIAIAVWKRLPAFVVNFFGTYIIRGLT